MILQINLQSVLKMPASTCTHGDMIRRMHASMFSRHCYKLVTNLFCVLILFIQTLPLYKSFTYLFTMTSNDISNEYILFYDPKPGVKSHAAHRLFWLL